MGNWTENEICNFLPLGTFNLIINHICSSPKVLLLLITVFWQLPSSPLYCLTHCFKTLPTTTTPGTKQKKGDHIYLSQYKTDGYRF